MSDAVEGHLEAAQMLLKRAGKATANVHTDGRPDELFKNCTVPDLIQLAQLHALLAIAKRG